MSIRFRFLNPLMALDDRALLLRYADGRDQSAFEQVVKRHGRMVFGVCRRAIRDRHLAEDAFQAVFLVLARDPRRATNASSVGGWLFGVARRVSLAARRHQIRRARREFCSALTPDATVAAPALEELLTMLDEELAALPEALRSALVACYLEERTQDEAARELGWSLSTLRRRLEGGKEILRERLARRGVVLAVGLLTTALASSSDAAVPPLVPTPAPRIAQLASAEAQRGIAMKAMGLASVLGLTTAAAIALSSISTAKPAAVTAQATVVIPSPGNIGQRGLVRGRVVFPADRTLPKPRPVAIDQIKGADVWAPFGHLNYADRLVHQENRGIANAVVSLQPDSDYKAPRLPVERSAPGRHTIRAAAGQFEPRVVAVHASDRVTFENRLPVPTNIRFTTTTGDPFNVLLATGMEHTTDPLRTSSAPDQFASSIYPWMTGWVWVFEHPYFAVTDADGGFEIANVPIGSWRVIVWHEIAGYRGGPGRKGTKIAVQPQSTDRLELTFESANWPE